VKRRIPFPLLILAGILGLAFVGSLMSGPSGLTPATVLRVLSGGGDATAQAIVLQLRLPRSVLAILVGGGLALAGCVFQALLRNPLAEPYILGVSGGAAVGAVAAVVMGWSVRAPWSLPLSAFAGALVAIGVVLRIALSVGPSLNARVFILAGVVVGAFFNAVILLMLSLADAESFRSAIFWMMGSLSGAAWGEVFLLAGYLVPLVILLSSLARPLNLLAVGEDTATYLGVRVERVKWIAYLATSLLVAATVAVSGIIGFVGLIVPHALRLLWGSDHRLLLPASVVAGGAFLLVTDTVARTVAAPLELPTGVVTALVGVPVFVWLLVRSGR
jgi:iron complex transport system permease protein